VFNRGEAVHTMQREIHIGEIPSELTHATLRPSCHG